MLIYNTLNIFPLSPGITYLTKFTTFISSRQAEGEWEAPGDPGQADGQTGAEQEGVWSSEAGKQPTAGATGAQQPGKLPAAGFTAPQQGGAAQVHTHTTSVLMGSTHFYTTRLMSLKLSFV